MYLQRQQVLDPFALVDRIKGTRFLQRSLAIKSSLFGVWLALVLAVLYALYHQNRFFALENRTIATLKHKTGAIVVRSEGLVQWHEIAEHQGLYDGDRLATARGASAVIDFGPGRALAIGEDTQVQVTAIQTANREYAFMIKLVRGSVVAEVKGKCDHCPPLIMRAGEDTIHVATGNKVGLVKQAGVKAKQFDPKGAWPVARAKPAPTLLAAGFDKDESETAAAEPVASPAAATPSPSPTATPAPAAAGFEAEVRPPTAGLVYWTTLPLAALSNTALDFPLTLPAGRPKQGDWRPVAEISGKGKTDMIAATAADANVRVPIMKLRGLATASMRGGIKEYVFSIRGGDEVTLGKQKLTSFSSHALTARILTVGEFPSGPLSVGVDRLAPADGTASPWMDPKGEMSVDAAAVAVHLVSSGDYPKLLPIVRGASRLGIARTGLVSNAGIFVVRNQSVIAQITGSGAGPAAVTTLFGALDGDFAFKGDRSVLHDTRGASATALMDWMGALLDQGKVLYILKKNKLYPVSREFIKTNAEVAQFIDSQAKAIFLEKVEIIAYK